MRIAHFSDLHYGTKTLQEADRCFGAAIDRAAELRADAAVISGDATDHALDLHSPAATRLVAQVRRLADLCPVLLLQGTFSHEPPGTLSLFRSIGGHYPVHVADRIGQVALTRDRRWRASGEWRFGAVPGGAIALFTCVPTVNKAVVAATCGAADSAQAVGEQLARLLGGYAPINGEARKLGIPTIAVSHGTVFGCLSEHGVPMAGFDHEFTTGALFAAQTQAFMLGHIHRHQTWSQSDEAGDRLIAYAGSIGRFHHGEAGSKGFLMWEVEATRARCALEEAPARRTIDIDFPGRPDLDLLRKAVEEQGVGDASVRVRWTVAVEERDAVDRDGIRRLLQGAASVKLEGRIVSVERSRAEGIAALAGIEDKVRAWAKVAQVSVVPMLRCLAALQEASPEDVATSVLMAVAET